MKNIIHHDESVFHHSLEVAYLSFVMARKLNLDVVSTVRGALLHDFYLYKFNKRTWKIFYTACMHIFDHPKIAYDNAQKYFEINKIEKDIILKHMFPFGIPIYRESWIVSLADKILATGEYSRRLKKYGKRKLGRLERL
ncbi:MAG: HD domain-containing protein [Eubacteriaceae bacterium]